MMFSNISLRDNSIAGWPTFSFLLDSFVRKGYTVSGNNGEWKKENSNSVKPSVLTLILYFDPEKVTKIGCS